MNLFKPEDFNQISPYTDCKDKIAFIANRILTEHLETLPLVYTDTEYIWCDYKVSNTKRFARLIDIQELKPKVCEHEPNNYHPYAANFGIKKDNKCKYCGIELQATWTAKELNK
jgi:hypothetical protein